MNGQQNAISRDDIRRQREALEIERAQLEKRVEAIKGEIEDLVATERVFDRIGKAQDAQPAAQAEEPVKRGRRASKRPEGVPSNADMIVGALRAARERGARGLVASELMDVVRDLYWPEVPYSSIIPTASRLVKEARIAKEGELYMPAGNEENSEGEALNEEALNENAPLDRSSGADTGEAPPSPNESQPRFAVVG